MVKKVARRPFPPRSTSIISNINETSISTTVSRKWEAVLHKKALKSSTKRPWSDKKWYKGTWRPFRIGMRTLGQPRSTRLSTFQSQSPRTSIKSTLSTSVNSSGATLPRKRTWRYRWCAITKSRKWYSTSWTMAPPLKWIAERYATMPSKLSSRGRNSQRCTRRLNSCKSKGKKTYRGGNMPEGDNYQKRMNGKGSKWCWSRTT